MKELAFLSIVKALDTRGGTGTWSATCKEHPPSNMVVCLAQDCVQPIAHVMPRPAIVVLLLCPNKFCRIRVLIEVGPHLFPGERMKLLYSCNGRVLDSCHLSVLLDRGIHLAGAENHTLNCFRMGNGTPVLRVRNDWLESGRASEVSNTGTS